MIHLKMNVAPHTGEPLTNLKARRLVAEELDAAGTTPTGVTIETPVPVQDTDFLAEFDVIKGGNYSIYVQSQDKADNWSLPANRFEFLNARDVTAPLPDVAPVLVDATDTSAP